jgi:hypothetical protein
LAKEQQEKSKQKSKSAKVKEDEQKAKAKKREEEQISKVEKKEKHDRTVELKLASRFITPPTYKAQYEEICINTNDKQQYVCFYIIYTCLYSNFK